jgi:hypothetical protein
VESPNLLLFAVIKGCETKGAGWSEYACKAFRALRKVHSYIKFTNCDYKPLGNKMMNVNIQHIVTQRVTVHSLNLWIAKSPYT